MIMLFTKTIQTGKIGQWTVLRDVDDNIVTVFLKKSFTIQETSYKMPLETRQELVEISVTFEDSLHILRNARNE